MSRVFRTAASTVLALVTVATLPGVALAATALSSEVPVRSSGQQDFTLTTSRRYWSVVAVMPPFGADYDLSVTGPGGSRSSSYDASYVDFVAIDGNWMDPATYTAMVYPWLGATGTFTVEFDDPGKMFQATPGQTFENGRIVQVYDAYLTAGQYYGLRSGLAGDIFLMASDPAAPGTGVRSRSQAAARTNVMASDSVCSTYRAPRSAWYGVVVVTGWQGGLPQTRQKGTLAQNISLNDPIWTNCAHY